VAGERNASNLDALTIHQNSFHGRYRGIVNVTIVAPILSKQPQDYRCDPEFIKSMSNPQIYICGAPRDGLWKWHSHT